MVELNFAIFNKMILSTMRFQFVGICDILLNRLNDVFTDVYSNYKTYLLKV